MYTYDAYDYLRRAMPALKKVADVSYEDLQIKNINDINEVSLHHCICSILDDLSSIVYKLDYFTRPIEREGILVKNERNRYELDGHEYTSGQGIEVLLSALEHNRIVSYWIKSRIEHNGEDYYLVDDPTVSLEGLPARIRSQKE